MSVFHGVGAAMITPFGNDGVNFDAFGSMIEYLIDGKIDSLIVCGTTGEPATMTADERRAAIAFAVEKTGGRVPVIAGCGCNSTAETVANARAAQSLGADALLVVTPYYNKCTQNGLVAHYTAVAEAVDIPVIVYNVPSRTGVNLLPSTMLRLSEVKKHRRHQGGERQYRAVAGACSHYSRKDGRLSRRGLSDVPRHDAGLKGRDFGGGERCAASHARDYRKRRKRKLRGGSRSSA